MQTKSEIRYPDPALGIEGQDDILTAAMCIFGEARGESDEAKSGVANVIANRVALKGYMGKTIKEVCLKPWQFSSFNWRDPNRLKLLEPLKHERPEVWESCYRIAEAVLTTETEDNTRGATHYFDISIKPPKWAMNATFTVQIGRIRFFKNVA